MADKTLLDESDKLIAALQAYEKSYANLKLEIAAMYERYVDDRSARRTYERTLTINPQNMHRQSDGL